MCAWVRGKSPDQIHRARDKFEVNICTGSVHSRFESPDFFRLSKVKEREIIVLFSHKQVDNINIQKKLILKASCWEIYLEEEDLRQVSGYITWLSIRSTSSVTCLDCVVCVVNWQVNRLSLGRTLFGVPTPCVFDRKERNEFPSRGGGGHYCDCGHKTCPHFLGWRRQVTTTTTTRIYQSNLQ